MVGGDDRDLPLILQIGGVEDLTRHLTNGGVRSVEGSDSRPTKGDNNLGINSSYFLNQGIPVSIELLLGRGLSLIRYVSDSSGEVSYSQVQVSRETELGQHLPGFAHEHLPGGFILESRRITHE